MHVFFCSAKLCAIQSGKNCERAHTYIHTPAHVRYMEMVLRRSDSYAHRLSEHRNYNKWLQKFKLHARFVACVCDCAYMYALLIQKAMAERYVESEREQRLEKIIKLRAQTGEQVFFRMEIQLFHKERQWNKDKENERKMKETENSQCWRYWENERAYKRFTEWIVTLIRQTGQQMRVCVCPRRNSFFSHHR